MACALDLIDTTRRRAPRSGSCLASRHAREDAAGPDRSPASALAPSAGNLAVQQRLRAGQLQARLAMSEPGDPDELAADRFADQALRKNAPDTGAHADVTGHGGATCAGGVGSVDGAAHRHEPLVAGAIRTNGAPLPQTTRSFFEARLGIGLGQVRVHTGVDADHGARALGARAFTLGHDIVFAKGEYAPAETTGRRLLAHELAHVAQQAYGRRAGDVQRQAADACAAPDDLPCDSVVEPQGLLPGHDLFFDSEVAELSAAQRDTIRSFVEEWRAVGGTDPVEVDGWASADGPCAVNWWLSCRRALNVRDELIAQGVGAPIAMAAHGPSTKFQGAAARRVTIQRVPAAPLPITPPAPAAGPELRCGPNVSAPVRDAVARLHAIWAGWTAYERDAHCGALHDPSTAPIAWDIIPLHVHHWIADYPSCATPPRCGRTVEIDGHCYYAGSANYVIFGTMASLCGFPDAVMRTMVWAYKGPRPWAAAAPNYIPSLEWSIAGYAGWPHGGTAPGGDRPHCATGCPINYFHGPFSISWHPDIL